MNPLFAAGFFGTPVLCLLLILSLPWRWHEPGAAYLLVAGSLYLAGTFLVTTLGNVPLNEALAAVAPTDPGAATR